ncbi:hypothetical protein [Chryseobacterium sediminis]|nr:hypothetical protein [Chryseobacterium sediminis]MBP1165097.1 hypothetical protein [Chryseobacterium sp. PvR013]
MTLSVRITIANEGGIFYINGKRLGHDTLTEMEMQVLNEFIKEFKQSNQ